MKTAVQRIRGLPELGMALFLLLLGTFVLVDASQIPTSFSQRGPVGPAAVPFFVGTGLLVTAVLLVIEVLRGHRAVPEDGEDLDLSSGTDWRTLLLIAGFFLANAVLIQPLGWPVSGAILFWGSAYALGSRHYIRNGLIAVALSVGSYLLFALVLGLPLPAGLLGGIL
jgi:putative tricarboxylic transport membrane protein